MRRAATKGLEEFDTDDLVAELARRKKAGKDVCAYCGRKTDTPACRFTSRHTDKTPLYSKQIGDTLYTFTGAFCEGAQSYFLSHPYNNPYDPDDDEGDDDRHQEWEDGNALASTREITQDEVKKAAKVAKARKA